MRILISAVFLSSMFAQTGAQRTAGDEVRTLYQSGCWARVVEFAGTAQARSADLEFYLGLSQVRLNDFESARRALLTGHKNFPEDARFAEELAGLAYREKNSDEAKQWLERALDRNPHSEYANDFLGLLFLADNNLPAALKYWNRIRKPVVHSLSLDPAPALNSLLLERSIAFSAGQMLSLDRLYKTQSNLERIGVLNGYRFELLPREDKHYDLTLRSAGTIGTVGGWAGRLLPYVRGLPYETVYFDLNNIRQKATDLSTLARWDSNKRRLAISVSAPVHLNPRWLYRVGIDARDETWDLTRSYNSTPGGLSALKLHKVEIGGDSQYALTGKLEWTSGLWVAKREYSNHAPAGVFANSWSAQFRNRLDYLLWNLPERRLRMDGSAYLNVGRVSGKGLEPNDSGREVIARAALSTTWLPHARNDDLAVRMHLDTGGAYGAVPFDDYFMLGMERDNDPGLWLRGHVGTRDGRKGNAPLGTRYLVLRTEVERTVWRLRFLRLQLAPFLDYGTIADAQQTFGSRGSLVDSGLQAKIKVPGNLTLSLIYGRDLIHGTGVFYSAVTMSRRPEQ